MSGFIISTIPDRCKRCFSCIRECPAKAILVSGGQARIIEERCIACGHCIKVCSQCAKLVSSDATLVLEMLKSEPDKKKIAVLAPSFAASFPENYYKVITGLKEIGFDLVSEVSFGADLTSNSYISALMEGKKKPVISSTCPAVFNFIQKYYQALVPNLATIVSPVIALGKFLRKEYGKNSKIVFIGPCVAKKAEILDESVRGVIDFALSFAELKMIFEGESLDINTLEDGYFDPPHSNMGKALPLAGGLLKATDLPGDVLDEEIIVVEGKEKVVEIIEEIANNNINARFVDILFCEGCISGPAIDSELNYYSRREKVIEFIKRDLKQLDKKVWRSNIYNSRDIDFSREFKLKSQRKPVPPEKTIEAILRSIGKFGKENELNCGSCGYATCREFAISIGKGLGEIEMCLPHLLDTINNALEHLRKTQEQLQNAEKLASIGQLAAGVAHEINNPLGTIMVYSSLLQKQLAKAGTAPSDYNEDLNLILQEANRCKSIVANLLNFARQGKLKISEFDVPELIGGIVRKLKVSGKFTDIDCQILDFGKISKIQADKDQIEQVITNILVNAIDAVEYTEKKEIRIGAEEKEKHLYIYISDSGCGIKKEEHKKLYTPFFTTKEPGKGTGLGLAITYGIIKMHRGDIYFESEEGKGTKFTVKLPLILNLNN
ncbi:MAG: GHKL domain-containing protein [Ignavibacteriaceae bacterium]|nr:GHKL domain-containing protein [Ignavibacteriaceae bacterium]